MPAGFFTRIIQTVLPASVSRSIRPKAGVTSDNRPQARSNGVPEAETDEGGAGFGDS